MIIIKILVIGILLISIALSVYHRKRIQKQIDYAISKSFGYQLLLLVLATCVAFFLLLTFIWLAHGNLKTHVVEWLFAYINPGSFFNPDGKEISDKAWAIVIGVFGMIFLSGLLISVIGNMLERRVDKVKNGQAYYMFKDHVIIIGYDRMTISLIKQISEKYAGSAIVLQTIQETPGVRHELCSHLSAGIEKRTTIVSGNRSSTEDLEKLHPDKCREIFLLGENGEYDHDSVNIDCLKKLRYILEEKKAAPGLKCNVLFEYQSTYAVFQRQDLSEIKTWIDFVPFNFYENWAQKLFVEGKYQSPDNKDEIIYPQLDREGITVGSPKTVHLVVAGMSRMGIALGVQASHLCHFPNFISDKTKKTRITFIDDEADREMNFLKGRYRHLFKNITHTFEDVENPNNNQQTSPADNFTDIEWHFVKGRIEHPAIQSKMVAWSKEENSLLTIAVCFRHPPTDIAAGLYLPDEVYDREIPVLIRQATSYTILSMVGKSDRYKHVKPFGMLDNSYDLNHANDLLPMMVKYMYDETSKNYKEYGEKVMAVKTFVPETMRKCWKDWKDSKGEDLKNITVLKWSNIYHANMTQIKIRSLGILPGVELNAEQINYLARVEHNRWNIEKLLMGYRPCTPEEAADIANGRKTKQELTDAFIHNNIKPYDALTQDDKGIQADVYDVAISRALPFMLSELEKYNNNNQLS